MSKKSKTEKGGQRLEPAGSGTVQIVQLSPNDWTVLRDLKLKSIDQEPIAFADPGPERNKYVARTEDEWRDILAGKMSNGEPGETVMFFARVGNEYVGMVSAIVPADRSRTATIQHMFVDRTQRGRHIGRQLLEHLVVELKSKPNLDKAELQVVATQTPAVMLYQSLGFQQTKVFEGEAVRDGISYDEIEMELDLR